MAETKRTVESKTGWTLAADELSLHVTQLGGMMSAVRFGRSTGKPFEPYYMSPWQNETRDDIDPPVLTALRGDFFCMPFGADNRYKGEEHTVHGEPATAEWSFEKLDQRQAAGSTVHTLELSMRTKERPGTITKRLQLKDGENVIYVQHVLEGYGGPTTLGHHATLRGGEEEDRIRISTSPYRLAMTAPKAADYTQGGEYYSLAELEEFDDLEAAPTVWSKHPTTDISRFPKRRGFVDIAGLYKGSSEEPAWLTAQFVDEGWMWFSLKDPRMLPATVFWMENLGRHQAPWDGRNSCLGLEDVCGFFAQGLTESVEDNPVSLRGIPTVVNLHPDAPTVVNYIQGAAAVPQNYDGTERVEFEAGKVRFVSASGATAEAAVEVGFLQSGSLGS
jgi:hypothetical protein